MVSKINEDIRKKLKVENIHYCQLAEYIGVSKWTLYEWLSVPLEDDKKARIMQAIEKYQNAENSRPTKENDDIRQLIARNEMTCFQVAYNIGISRRSLYRWLKKPLTQEKREMIMNAIRQQA